MTDMASLRDHDLLVSLNGKADRMSDDIREIRSNTAVTFDSQEKRIRSLEDTTKIYDPNTIRKMVNDHDKWIEDFRSSWRIGLFFTSIIGGIIGFILSVLNGIWPWIRK